MGRRTSACVPVTKARPDCRVYLSSSLACRTRSGAFMSPSILPGREPRSECLADFDRAFEGREVAAFLYDLEGRPGNPVRHFLVPFQGRDRVLAPAQNQGGAGDRRQKRQAVAPAHDRFFLPDEGISPNVSGHLHDSVTNSLSSSRLGWMNKERRERVTPTKRPRCASEIMPSRLARCSGVSARALVSRRASRSTRCAAWRTISRAA